MSKPVCVFCGSSPGVKALYTKSAQAVGRALAAEGTKLVYGGGRRGIMGVVSQSALEAGGHVHGIVPSALTVRAAGSGSAEKKAAESAAASSAEGAGKDLLDDMQKYEGRLQLEIVGSMHERKTKMAQVSTGGFIVLPGGYGTFEEAFEMITWNQLRIHQLPVVIPNVDNFYTPLRDLVESAAKSGFINPENLSLVKIVDLDGEGGNSDESRAEEWGAAAIKALKEFKFSAGAGYNLQWNTETSTPEP